MISSVSQSSVSTTPTSKKLSQSISTSSTKSSTLTSAPVSASTIEAIPLALFQQHSFECYAATSCDQFRFIWSVGSDGIIRKFDFFASLNNKSHLTQSQKHGLVDSIVKNVVIASTWGIPKEPNLPPSSSPLSSGADATDGNVTAKTNTIATKKITSSNPPTSNVALQNSKSNFYAVHSFAVQKEALWAFAGLENGSVKLVSIRTHEGRIHHSFDHGNLPISALALSDSLSVLLSGSWDKKIKIWNLDTGQLGLEYNLHHGQITHIAWQPIMNNSEESNTSSKHSHVFLSSAINGSLFIWDAREQSHVKELGKSQKSLSALYSAVWHPDGQHIFCGRRDGSFEDWDLRKIDSPCLSIKFPYESGPISKISHLPNTDILLCASFDNLRYVHIPSLSTSRFPFKIIPGHHGGTISDLVVSDDGRYIVSVSGTRGWEGHSNGQTIFYYIK